MNRNDIIDLLSFIAIYDKRTGGELDVKAWLMAAQSAGWQKAPTERAVAEMLAHEPGLWLTPAHVTAKLVEVRRDISRRIFSRDITPPAELEGDIAAELDWRRTHVPAVINNALDKWAQTGELPAATNELDQASPEGQQRLKLLIGKTFRLPPGRSA